MPITRINSQELFVATHEWKNEMQRSYILKDSNGYHYWLNVYYMPDNSHPFVLVHGYNFYEGDTIIIHSLQIKS